MLKFVDVISEPEAAVIEFLTVLAIQKFLCLAASPELSWNVRWKTIGSRALRCRSTRQALKLIAIMLTNCHQIKIYVDLVLKLLALDEFYNKNRHFLSNRTHKSVAARVWLSVKEKTHLFCFFTHCPTASLGRSWWSQLYHESQQSIRPYLSMEMAMRVKTETATER